MRFLCQPLLGCLLVLWPTLPRNVAAQATTGSTQRVLRGRFADAADGHGIAGVRVLVDSGGSSALSGSDGRFVLAGLPAAPRQLRIRALGYQPVMISIDLTRSNRDILVTLQRTTVRLDSIVAAIDRGGDPLREERATSRLDAEQLARARGQTLGETLKAVPGVVIIQYGPSIAKPVVRGLSSQRIVVMNGAVAQEGQQWGAEHAPEIDVFAANDVEVIRGAAGVLYGSDAIGGVIRVLPRSLPLIPGIAGELQLNTFSNNQQGAISARLESGALHLPLAGNVAWRVQGTLRRAEDARTAISYLPNTAFSERDYAAAIGVRRTAFSSSLSFSHFGTDLGMYAGAHVGNLDDLARAMTDPIVSDEQGSAIRRPNQTVDHDLLTWSTEAPVRSNSKLELNYGYQYNNRNEYDSKGFAAAIPRPAFGLRLITHSLDIRLHHALSQAISGTIGVTGTRQGNLSPGRSFLIPQYRLYTGGIFALEQWTSHAWTVNTGLRYDARWQHAFQYGKPVVVSPDDVSAYHGITGSLGVTWQFASAWSVTGTTGRLWRAPNVNERFSQGVHHGTAQYEIGDSTLGKERTTPVDATIRYQGERLRLEVSSYRNQIDGYIYLRPREPVQTVRGAYPAYQYSATDALLRGLEVSARYDPSATVALSLSGTMVRGTDRDARSPLYDMPADRLLATARYTASVRRRIAEPFIELGVTLVRRQNQLPPAMIYRLPTDGYMLLNLDAGVQRATVLGHVFELGISARNLLNTRYRDYLSRYRLYVDNPGRDLVFRLRTPLGRGAL